jgi:hypothetical protein
MTELAQEILEAQIDKARKGENDFLDEATGLKAVEVVSAIAAKADIEWALVGGFALALYGNDRMTKDIDIIASGRLPLESVGQLRQGGERYVISAGEKKINVDWIIRNDEAKKYFAAALAESTKTSSGLPILTPEWLVILKYIANRFKDQEDAVFLLSKKGLVNRQRIKEIILKIGGNEAWVGFKPNLRRWYNLADGIISRAEDGYIDS